METANNLVNRQNEDNGEKDKVSVISFPQASKDFRLKPKKQNEQKEGKDEFKVESYHIMKHNKELLKKVQQKNIQKLFKTTMWQTYSHSSFPNKKPKEVVKAKKKFEGLEYEKQRNLTHYTVHEFNEALYFALREFSTYVNFS